ncbi:MAG: hypothetical protein ABW106_00590 [Steroidobacteraceae bacterium]
MPKRPVWPILSVLGAIVALAVPLLFVPLFAADAQAQAPADASLIKELLTQHNAPYVMRAYSRVPLQCATEVHGA